LVLAAGLLLAAGEPQDDVVKKETAKLQGTWKFVSMEVEGKKKPDEEMKKFTLTVRGDQWTVEFKNESEIGTAMSQAPSKFKVDPTQKPRAIDFLLPNGKVLWGIYTLDKDGLTVCYGQAKGGRPTAFATGPDSRLILYVLLRQAQPGDRRVDESHFTPSLPGPVSSS
jgi:uncharacterized protein (TIGR03067 family)